jgi:hypothetical protein
MTWQAETETITFYDEETEKRLKVAFALALLRHPNNPYDAAREIEPTAPGRANWIVNSWLHDEAVLQLMGKHIADVGVARSGLPSKEELAQTIYKEAADVKDKTTRLSYYRAVADIMGYTTKSGININNNVINQPKIMRIPVFATDADFEAKAKMIEHRMETMQ